MGLHLLMKRRSVSLSGHEHDHGGFLRWERLPLRCYSGGPISSPQGCHQGCQVRPWSFWWSPNTSFLKHLRTSGDESGIVLIKKTPAATSAHLNPLCFTQMHETLFPLLSHPSRSIDWLDYPLCGWHHCLFTFWFDEDRLTSSYMFTGKIGC